MMIWLKLIKGSNVLNKISLHPHNLLIDLSSSHVFIWFTIFIIVEEGGEDYDFENLCQKWKIHVLLIMIKNLNKRGNVKN